jgi:Ca2+-binding EF-hand superfamily protein
LFDKNGDGAIDFEELLSTIKGDMGPFRKDLIKRVFKKLDYNDNGVIEINDVK